MKKRLFSLAISIVLLISLLPAPIWAAEEPTAAKDFITNATEKMFNDSLAQRNPVFRLLTDIENDDVTEESGSDQHEENITVSFTLLGDEQHDSDKDGIKHTYKKDNLTVWIPETKVTVEKGSKVIDVISDVLEKNDITYNDNGGSYISSVNNLAASANGANSGWMYLLNGEYASLGIAEQTVAEGDRIVLHFTDDYFLEFEMDTPDEDDTGGKDPRATGSKRKNKNVADSTVQESKSSVEKNPAEVICFEDTKGKWFSEAVNYVSGKGLMDGTGDNKFAPGANLSRAMAVTILARLDNADLTKGEKWFSASQKWAVENDISDGTDMEDQITREQLAAMLYRYAQKKGNDITRYADINSYSDAAKVHVWAEKAMSWANATGLINGRTETILAPVEKVTRAETAVIIQRFCETTAKAKAEEKEEITENNEMLSAAEKNRLNSAVAVTASYVLESTPNPEVSSVGGEWAVIGLKKSEASVPENYYRTYAEKVKSFLTEKNGERNRNKYTEFSRVALALTVFGYDALDFASYNLISLLFNYEKVVSQGINGPVWALIALNSGNYQTDGSDICSKYISFILDRQLTDGGWNLSGTSSDVDVTAMVLQALALYHDRIEVKKAVDDALLYLSNIQNADGGFSSDGEDNAESCAQVLIALSELGISPKDSLFVKNNKTVVDALLEYQLADGSFCHIENGEGNQMSTEQALLALTDYLISQNGGSIFR